jgi:hypothetical protein
MDDPLAIQDDSGITKNETSQADVPSQERIDALKKNLAYLWEECISLTGLPVDTLMAQVFRNASQQGLPAQGAMMDFGGGTGFAPTRPTLSNWLDSYFMRVMPPPNDMPEA